MELNDRNRWMPPPDPNKKLDFWFKFDPETHNFLILFDSPANHQRIKVSLSTKLMERFMDESLAFFIDIMNREESEEDENSTGL
jgi:hypothetical protein